MAKEKKPATDTPEEKPKKIKAPTNRLSAISQKFILIIWLIGCAIIAGIHFGVTEQIIAQNQHNRIDMLSKTANAILQQKFSSIDDQLIAISRNDELHNVLLISDADELANLEEILAVQFQNIENLRIIPWDELGTAGVKQRGIELRNNIEYALLTKAASSTDKKHIPPEVYQVGKNWLVSFALPIIIDDNVKGIILLSLKPVMFNHLYKTDFFKSNGQFTINQKGNGKSIFSIGEGYGEPYKFDLPFDGGELEIKLKAERSEQIQQSFIIIYITVGIATLLISLLIFVFTRMTHSSIKKDSESILQYIQSLKGLHEPKKPILNIPQLQTIIAPIGNLRGTEGSAIIDDKNRKSVLTGSPKSSNLAPTAAEEVVETFTVENPHIFKDYDIRGLADRELDSDTVKLIGQAIGSEALARGKKKLVLGQDNRSSSPRISEALIAGITSTGCNVVKLGEVTTPMSYFAGKFLDTNSSIMVTGSHNGEEYNGIKIVLNGQTLAGEDIQQLKSRIELRDFTSGEGTTSEENIRNSYTEEIANDIITAKTLKVLVDTSSPLAADIATGLLVQCDCEVQTTEPVGSHNTQAVLQNLSENILATQCDLGIAFDSDADRLMVVTNSGKTVDCDKLIMLFAKDIVTRNPGGSVVFDVKCSREVPNVITQSGGRAIMHKSGHSNIKQKMLETDAIFAGEYSGHLYFKERWYGFDDGIYAALRLVELLSASEQTFDERIAEFPATFTSDEYYIEVFTEEDKERIVSYITNAMSEQKGEKITIDGFRIEFDAGWGLVRPSNTEQAITLRFEAKSQDLLTKLQALFKAALQKAEPSLNIPF